MIAIINYDAGNLASVSNALQRLDEPHTITNKYEKLEEADGIIFPGVGHAQPAMAALEEHGLDRWLRKTSKPVLGICLGMQLLYEYSEEGGAKGLGIIPGRLKKFDATQRKVPHMGWNNFKETSDHPLTRNLQRNKHYFYYVHSYYAPLNEYTEAISTYVNNFTAVVSRDNYMGVQFHPEKSGDAGALLLENFLSIVETEAS